MNSTLDPDRLLDLILERCIQICEVGSGSLMLISRTDEVLDIVTFRGMNPSVRTKVKLRVGEGITGIVAASGEGMIVNDVTQNPHYISIKDEILSELAVPMIVEDEVIGVISLDSSRKQAFSDEHLELVSTLANMAAQIFKNLQTFRQLEQKNKIQQVLIDISRTVTSTLILQEIFDDIMERLDKSLNLERGSIVLFDSEKNILKLIAASGLTAEEMEKGVYLPGEGITGRVYENGEAVIVESIVNDENFLNRLDNANHFKNNPENVSFLAAPIKSDTDVLGVVSVFFVHKKYVDLKTYLDFLQVVASVIYQAIRIQKLIDEEKREISRENVLLKRELKNKYKFGSLIGKSKSMEKLFEMIQLVSDSRASVLITGESGTGKEMIASAIHYNSSRSDKPFIKINCAAIPENLLESELFGHKKGSFTGAVADKKGKFEMADTGTIFLDEIGEMDLNLQSKLLRVLQEKEIEAVGSVKPKKIDVRIIAATNADLEDLISQKLFRADLYYRLNVVNMETPPLRDRLEDVPLLINHFISKYSNENVKKIKGITREAHKLLMSYTWPGNVRELENVIERAVVLSQSEMLDIQDFSDISGRILYGEEGEEVEVGADPEAGSEVASSRFSPAHLDALDGRAMEVVVGEVEARLIKYAMKKFKYTKTRVAKFLGINRNTLDKKIKDLKIDY
ncbi:GAF domain-containing protein [Leptospira langatensis]|uniref:GAF domain-containing protein n=1 Tax=Leptospira langatensis TaxID=2484983 RepID=A0A5F1ZVT5_9LEPT|nr:sigma 54-interacting transcriptional regulator [Leptospira langatensis]TGK01592.1 GAF domain-containing protein [Leptospira langatensis]TGL41958.1 GAF domain-containing protein [Leptospira langatensis]